MNSVLFFLVTMCALPSIAFGVGREWVEHNRAHAELTPMQDAFSTGNFAIGKELFSEAVNTWTRRAAIEIVENLATAERLNSDEYLELLETAFRSGNDNAREYILLLRKIYDVNTPKAMFLLHDLAHSSKMIAFQQQSDRNLLALIYASDFYFTFGQRALGVNLGPGLRVYFSSPHHSVQERANAAINRWFAGKMKCNGLLL